MKFQQVTPQILILRNKFSHVLNTQARGGMRDRIFSSDLLYLFGGASGYPNQLNLTPQTLLGHGYIRASNNLIL